MRDDLVARHHAIAGLEQIDQQIEDLRFGRDAFAVPVNLTGGRVHHISPERVDHPHPHCGASFAGSVRMHDG